ncbi:MAG: type II toxin-antitoxin system VapC family toxin [Ginsengibacter sp.]
MGWHKVTSGQLSKLRPFIQSAVIYSLAEHYIEQTILLRQKHKIKLPDAIIAATAIMEGLILITRNPDNFRNIEDLKIFNPWEL